MSDDNERGREEVAAVLKQRGRADRDVVVKVPIGALGEEKEGDNDGQPVD